MVTNDLLGMEKEGLEKLKLKFEIEESQHRVESERVNKKKEDLKSLLAIAISVGTIVTAGLTIGSTIRSYVEQKAQSEKLIVDEKMIQLVEKLSSPEKKVREYATILLSPYGKSAVPILLKYLEWSDELESTYSLIHVLRNIKQTVKPTDFNNFLMNAMAEVFRSEVKNLRHEGEEENENTAKSKTAILNYLLALKILGGDKDQVVKMLVVKMLSDLKKNVEESENGRSIEKVTKDTILSTVKDIEGGLNK